MKTSLKFDKIINTDESVWLQNPCNKNTCFKNFDGGKLWFIPGEFLSSDKNGIKDSLDRNKKALESEIVLF